MFDSKPGQTPIAAAELDGLIPPLSTQAELNDWEETNIIEGKQWALEHRTAIGMELLSADYMKELHRHMFDQTWRWAGKFRVTDKNIGVPFYKIAIELQTLLDDASYWIKNEAFQPDELAVRLHYRLVSIHLFPNGNGRHARLVADILVTKLGRPAFTWGSTTFAGAGEARSKYLRALRDADQGDYAPLIVFARS